MKVSKDKVKEYYDEFSSLQIERGISKRHEKIQEWLVKFGLKINYNVLEIGCGIGTQTQLLADFLVEGKITAVDISPKNIEIAKNRLSKYDNVDFIADDIVITDVVNNKKFDVIVLPDVLEHIPINKHDKLFYKLNMILKEDGFILIHIPNPYYLQWCHINKKDDLQIIDQPIFTEILCKNISPNNLHIEYLQTYEVWTKNGDYQIILLKKNDEAINFYPLEKKVTFFDKLKYKIELILGIRK